MKPLRHLSLGLLTGLALLALGGCGGSDSKPTSPDPTGGGTHQVTISGSAYSALTVPVGTTVTWKNEDSMAHTATSDAGSALAFNTGTIAAGATSTGIAFTQAGTFSYHCTFHAGMHGSITVQ
jgi:plastocyanin